MIICFCLLLFHSVTTSLPSRHQSDTVASPTLIRFITILSFFLSGVLFLFCLFGFLALTTLLDRRVRIERKNRNRSPANKKQRERERKKRWQRNKMVTHLQIYIGLIVTQIDIKRCETLSCFSNSSGSLSPSYQRRRVKFSKKKKEIPNFLPRSF